MYWARRQRSSWARIKLSLKSLSSHSLLSTDRFIFVFWQVTYLYVTLHLVRLVQFSKGFVFRDNYISISPIPPTCQYLFWKIFKKILFLNWWLVLHTFEAVNWPTFFLLKAQKMPFRTFFLFLFLFILFEFSFISPDIMSWTNLCHFWFINWIIVLFRIIDLQHFLAF